MAKRSSRLTLIIVGAACVAAACLFYFQPWQLTASQENIDWEVTVTGSRGEQKSLSYQEIVAMPSREAQGGYFTTVGVVYGPYSVRGVAVEDICKLVGGITPSDAVYVSAEDGYSMVFDYEQINGDLDTYQPGTMSVVPHEELELLLIFEQDGKPLTHADGKPLRLAVVGNADLLTEGHWWVKWVERIEVISLAGPEN
ncbi:MAG: molybdopterin-dependent oxidoreductase [Dehalococcoidales bacterium]|nr:molybdopterin-dependent oxidoreductase [Dehalococcoidales bacterium]